MPASRGRQRPSPELSSARPPDRLTAAQAFQDLFDAYDRVLSSIRGYDGKPAEATDLEKVALMSRIRKRLAVNAKMPPGYNAALTVQETARRLGVCEDHVYRLCREGRLNGIKVDRRIYIHPEDVRAYKHEQEVWRAAGGRWTPYGRKERKGPEPPYEPVESPAGSPTGESADPSHVSHPCHPAGSHDHPTTESPADSWIRAEDAAAMLGVCRDYMKQLAHRYGLVKKRVGGGRDGSHVLYRLDTFQVLQDERESRRWKRTIPPQQWNHDLRHPVVRTKIEAPPGDRLISVKEAAEILGVCRSGISHLVRKGRLFGWQEKPGHNGCPLFLSERQVIRCAEDPMRIKRRAAMLEGEAPPELKLNYDNTEWREWTGMVRYEGRHDRRDHGEFVSTYQAAEIMGITAGAVKALRKKGRLTGYRSKSKRPTRRWAWWFFLRDDIDALMADPEYARRRRAYDRGRAALRARQSEPPAIICSRDDEDD